MTSKLIPSSCSFCNGDRFEQIFSYDTPLKDEPNYSFFDTIEFYREVWECLGCGHLHIRPDFDISGIYEDDYMESNYDSLEGIHQEYDRIMNIPRHESNNIQRVENIHRFLANRFWFETNNNDLFDVGTGLGVFPGLMKQHGWDCTVLDPDCRAVEHARKHIGVTAHQGLLTEETPVETYDFVSLIKVLEHVKDPKRLLELGSQYLSESGICYIEVPDGPIAANEGPHRMEFTSIHYHAFSPESITRLICSTDMILLELERVHEPSGKYTLRVFCE
jgi:SAM-dependent methyltransferase